MEEQLRADIEKWVQSRLFDKFRLYEGRVWTEKVAGRFLVCSVSNYEANSNTWFYSVQTNGGLPVIGINSTDTIKSYIKDFYIREGGS